MRRFLALALVAAASLAAQGPDALSDWQFYREISPATGSGLATINVDAEVLANSRPDAADLRLFDSAGKGIPYKLRVLRGEQNIESFEAVELGRRAEGDAAEIVLDLGENPPEHNQVQVDTAGASFRRPTAVFGSDDAETWSPLNPSGLIMRIAGNGGSASIDRVAYPANEYRYLRILVGRDRQSDGEALPEIEATSVQRLTVIPAVEQSIPLPPPTPEIVGQGESEASRYTFDLPGAIPLNALQFNVSAESYTRTYRLVAIPGGRIAPFPIAVGRIFRREGQPQEPATVRFQDVSARQLQLTVADQGQSPLVLQEPVALTAVRQLVIDLGDAQPSRLYYGNPSAPAPNYDFKTEGPRTSDDSAPRLQLGPQALNPAYIAPPLPWNEQAPWLIYVLTAAASLALLAILRSLVFDVGS